MGPGGPGGSLAFEGMPEHDAPKVITPKALKQVACLFHRPRLATKALSCHQNTIVPCGPAPCQPLAYFGRAQARDGKKRPAHRRMSLASSFRADGQEKLGRIERMVELVRRMPVTSGLLLIGVPASVTVWG